jgi:competence protein ComEC
LTAVALDVGQGDAILLLGAGGAAVLVDGGPDPVVLEEALGRYRVERLELVVVTHGDQDHAGGLVHLPGRYPIGRIWFQGPPHRTRAWEELATAAGSAGIPLQIPSAGQVEVIDGLRLEVLGPRRRYDLINNQAIVLWVDAGATSLLLTADIEAIAQQELGTLRPEVLKVPHHGAATSDLAWLEATDPLLSIVSVGENDYGHPTDEVLSALSDSIIARTDLIGDVVVPLVGDPLRELPVSSSGRSPGTGR